MVLSAVSGVQILPRASRVLYTQNANNLDQDALYLYFVIFSSFLN